MSHPLGNPMLPRLLLILLMLWSGPAFAERRVALVLASEEYRHLRVLANPVHDALAVEDMLRGLGFDVTVETDRDLKRMRRALRDFEEDGAGADVALVFYAGHGVEIAGLNYLLPVDADASTSQALVASALPLSEVQAALATVAPVGIVLLDACREDPFGAGASGQGRSAAALEDAGADAPRPGLGRIGRADGVLFAFSAAPGEVAADGAGADSPFTEALLRHFATPGVEVRTALTLVQQDVYDRSRGKQLALCGKRAAAVVLCGGGGGFAGTRSVADCHGGAVARVARRGGGAGEETATCRLRRFMGRCCRRILPERMQARGRRR